MGNQDEDMFRPLSMEKCWGRSRHLLKLHVELYCKIAACVVIPIAFLFIFVLVVPIDVPYGDYSLFEVAVNTVAAIAANGPIMVATAAIYGGSTPEWHECFSIYFEKRMKTLVGAGLLAIVLVSFGSILLYLPGIYMAAGWFFVPCSIVFEDQNVMGSLKRSWQLTKVSRCAIFCTLTLSFLMAALPFGLLAAISVLFHELTKEHVLFGHDSIARFVGFTVYTVPSVAAKIVLLPLFIIIKTVMYINYRVKEEGLTAEEFRKRCKELKLLSEGWQPLTAQVDEEASELVVSLISDGDASVVDQDQKIHQRRHVEQELPGGETSEDTMVK